MWYPGTIVHMYCYLFGTTCAVSVRYDDGDFEEYVLRRFVRRPLAARHGGGARTEARAAPARARQVHTRAHCAAC